MPRRPKPIDANPIFYSDILARSLLRMNVPKYEAYKIAHKVWEDISRKKKENLKISSLVERILKQKYPHLIRHYHDWRKIMKKKKPVILLIGGGTGIGTSTLALRLAWLLEIDHVVSTDSVREVIRQVFPKDILPILHVSSFEAGEAVKEVKSPHDRVIYGFLTQSKEVLNGVKAIIKRAITENVSTVIEGVHLVPGEMGFLDKFKNDATIIQVMLDVKQKDKHRLHFFSRHVQSAQRSKEKYLKYFKQIRLIRDYLVEQAERNHVSIVQNYDFRKAEKEILESIHSSYVSQFKKAHKS